MAQGLSAIEQRRWEAWKNLNEEVRAKVAQEVFDVTGLSDPDFSVLAALMDKGKGQMRQQALCNALHWSKSRMSHHLTRMEERDLVTRKTGAEEGGVLVVCTAVGKHLIQDARPAHAQAVKKHLFGKLNKEELALLDKLFERLNG